MRDLHWNVFRHDFNSREIEVFDVFHHISFRDEVYKLLKKNLSRDEFSKELRSSAMYYFWSKCEYEVVVASWPPYITADELRKLSRDGRKHYDVSLEIGEKVDIFQQMNLNWEQFVDYVWGGCIEQ